MKIEQLLEGIKYKTIGNLPPEVEDVTSDSRRARENTLFVCIAGEKADGHNFASKAAESGCAAVVAEHDTGARVTHILVENSRRAYALMCANLFGRPAQRLKLVGVTGTNGKTTTSTLIKQILEINGHKSGLIGTIQNLAGDETLPANLTTPEPHELQQLFKMIADAGCEYAVMEVSSHALDQDRVAGCRFAAAVYTNLTQDHLDYHKNMENYLQAKLKLFAASEKAIVNLDDPYAPRVISAGAGRSYTYSMNSMQSDFTARNIRYRHDGVDYELVGVGVIGRVSVGIPGEFSVYNTLAAAVCAISLGIPFQNVIAALGSARGVKGRVEVVPTGRDFSIIIDYAHTPDALEKILKAIRGFSNGRIVAVFGCGGDRDAAKRPLMGAAAAENADYCIITSDNPRTEDPGKIIEDILPGVQATETPWIVIENRMEAIRYAIENARPQDIILLAGKGHEDYQIIGTQKHHLDEREVVAEILEQLPPVR